MKGQTHTGQGGRGERDVCSAFPRNNNAHPRHKRDFLPCGLIALFARFFLLSFFLSHMHRANVLSKDTTASIMLASPCRHSGSTFAVTREIGDKKITQSQKKRERERAKRKGREKRETEKGRGKESEWSTECRQERKKSSETTRTKNRSCAIEIR